jgi:A/G-specific adenine glycosylase
LADFYLMETNERPSLPPDYQWIAEQDFDDYGKPRLIDSHLPER